MINTTHDKASAYASHIVQVLNVADAMSIERGDTELVWDLAYDAFMYRELPALPLLPAFGPVSV